MLKSRKHVFWEAFFLTVVVFFFGLLIGVAYEGSRIDEINKYYSVSEISMMDLFLLGNYAASGDMTCENLINSNIEFADRIYEEAILLEQYESVGKIDEGLLLTHKKYDLMRTFLWSNCIKALEVCGNKFDLVVYLYEYETKDLAKKATQIVWSKILFDLKQKKGDDIVLIPIAADSSLISLESLLKGFNLTNYPVVIINNEHIITELSTVEELEKYLD